MMSQPPHEPTDSSPSTAVLPLASSVDEPASDHSSPGEQSEPDSSAPAWVGPDQMVTLKYAVFREDGECVDRSPDGAPPSVLFGYGRLLPALEAALEGARPGEHITVELSPDQAYGRRHPEGVLTLYRDELPPDIQAGDQFEAEHGEGGLVLLTVLEVRADAVLVDTNHPLAGQRIRFEVWIEGVRPATDSELDSAADALETQIKALPDEKDEQGSEPIPSRRLLERPQRS